MSVREQDGFYAAGSALMSLLLSGPALAQVPSSSAPDNTTLEEIVVTAERRAEPLQNVPVSVTALTGEQIAQALTNPYKLQDLVPGLTMVGVDGLEGGRVTIRGLGSSDNANPLAPTSTLIYYDGLASGTPLTGTLPSWDLQRIEVLRGPQGTLFGRNALAGVVQYISAEPTAELSGFADVTFGQYDMRRIEAAIGGPLSDSLHVRASGLSYERGPDLYNDFLKIRQGDRSHWGGRLIVDYDPTEALNITAKVQRFKSDWQTFRFAATPLEFVAPQFIEFQNIIGVTPGRQRDSNFRTVSTELVRPYELTTTDLAELDVNYSFGSSALTFVAGALDSDVTKNDDNDSWPVPITDLYIQAESKARSAELRLTSSTESAFQYIAGAYYQKEKSSFAVDFDGTAWFRDLDGNGLTRYDAVTAADQFDGVTPAFAGLNTIDFSFRDRQELKTYAAFLHTTYQWTDRFKTTQSVRWTHESKDINSQYLTIYEFPISPGVTAGTPAEHNDFIDFVKSGRQFELANAVFVDGNSRDANGNLTNPTFTNSWNKLTWRLAADYKLSDRVLGYASSSRGFRGGIFAVTSANAASAISADPEVSTVYELGLKSQWLDRRVQLNASVYYNDHKNYQTTQFVLLPGVGLANVISNVPKAELKGGEVELLVAPVKPLTLGVNVAVIDAKVKKVLPGNESLLGNKLPMAEDWSLSGFVRYAIATPFGSVIPGVSFRHVGEYYSLTTNNDLGGTLGDYWTADARIGFESTDGKLYGSLFLNNVSDEVRPVFSAQPDNVFGDSVSAINDRRSWGLSLGYRF